MIKALVQDGKLVFSSHFAGYNFWKHAEGKEVSLEIQEKPTDEMRRFFEGCLVPAMFYWHPLSGWQNFSDARDALKLQFLPGVRMVKLPSGDRVPVAPSLADVPKSRFQEFVSRITDWMIENGMPNDVIDSEAYKVWRDSIPEEWVYPPLQRLKDGYDKAQTQTAP